MSQLVSPARLLSIATVPGDGIGPEVVDATVPLLVAAARRAGVDVEIAEFDWGADRYLRDGAAMPADGADVLRAYDAVLFGAVGRPDVDDHELVRGLILRLRQALDLSVNLRPVTTLPGVRSPIATRRGVDLLIVRENTEGEYAGIGGGLMREGAHEMAVEVAIHTRDGVERIARFAFERARERRGRLTVVTKENVLKHGFGLWLSVVKGVSSDYPDVAWDSVLVDAMAARLVMAPDDLDVVLCSNLFGDILADLAACHMGGLGMAPSGNLASGGGAPGVFESVHGSAPDIAGTGLANPSACILSAALLLEHCGVASAAADLRRALGVALRGDRTTPDLGGASTTRDFAAAVMAALEHDLTPDTREGAPT